MKNNYSSPSQERGYSDSEFAKSVSILWDMEDEEFERTFLQARNDSYRHHMNFKPIRNPHGWKLLYYEVRPNIANGGAKSILVKRLIQDSLNQRKK